MDAPKLYGINRLRETLEVKEATRRSMQANRSRETGPELALRRALWASGLRGYRKNVRRLPGTPDVVVPRARLAVFVHGCFWHGCTRCGRARVPRQNHDFWAAKIAVNQARHERDSARLAEMGFRVLTFWECELREGAACVAEVVLRHVPPGPS